MANTYTLIEAKTSTASSVVFSSIPATFTDLKLLISARSQSGGAFEGLYISLNGTNSNFTGTYLQGIGSGTPSSGSIARYVGIVTASAATGNTFSNIEIYFCNYASSNYKSFSSDSVTENNATLSFAEFHAGLWSDATAINSITLTPTTAGFATGSTFYLYGIKNS
jgi:hypothetical protein